MADRKPHWTTDDRSTTGPTAVAESILRVLASSRLEPPSIWEVTPCCCTWVYGRQVQSRDPMSSLMLQFQHLFSTSYTLQHSISLPSYIFNLSSAYPVRQQSLFDRSTYTVPSSTQHNLTITDMASSESQTAMENAAKAVQEFM